MLVGIDFDNTIVCYDQLFKTLAEECLELPEDTKSKEEIRNHFRKIGREDDWTELQGFAYGNRILEATPFPGVLDFFNTMSEENIPVVIVSHKTVHPYRGPKVNLQDAAKDWLAHHGLTEVTAHFEITKLDKIERIKKLNCDYFIDDLPEFLSEKSFPESCRRILFSPHKEQNHDHLKTLRNWKEIKREILQLCKTTAP